MQGKLIFSALRHRGALKVEITVSYGGQPTFTRGRTYTTACANKGHFLDLRSIWLVNICLAAEKNNNDASFFLFFPFFFLIIFSLIGDPRTGYTVRDPGLCCCVPCLSRVVNSLC